MASFQTTQYIENLTVNTIFTRGINNNSNIPAYRVLTTDGQGGTMWMTLSSLQYGAGYHSFITTGATYTADSITNASFSILDGPNAGLINDPTASNTAYLYAKAFGQFDISGGNSLYAFDTNTNSITSNVLFVGTGGINIKGDPQTNTLFIDGRELPFVSTLPYSFNEMVVYSNAPLNTIIGSTVNKSIILQAQGPSTILSFLGEDMIVIDTNYAANQIKFKLSSLTLSGLSTIRGQTKFLLDTYVNKTQLSTLSTSYGPVLTITTLQDSICTMSTTLDNKIAYNSTIVGDVSVYSRGISSVWYQFQKDRYLLDIKTTSNLLSTSGTLQTEIDVLNDRVFTNGQDIIGSTLRTPYFWTSTIATLVYASPDIINNPTTVISPLNVTYYNSYSSFYNVFNDSQPFGSPIPPSVQPTSLNVTSGTTTFSTVSTSSGKLFSTLFAVEGTFAFLPNDDPHPFSVTWSGNLSFNINGVEYATDPVPYPRMGTFLTSNTITANITAQPICIVNFSYSKINATDFLTFNNLTDYIEDCLEYYNVAPIYNAYGYNTKETPIYSESLTSFPTGFSTHCNLVASPYLALSSYVMIASTFYTSGCNTTFAVAGNGYTSLTFNESTTKVSKIAYNANLSTGTTTNLSLTPFSASNTFGYSFTTVIPSTPYTLEVLYARQKNPEILIISTPYLQNYEYSYDPRFYVSSALYTKYTSSVNTDIANLTVSTINGLSYKNLQFSDISTISTIYWNLLNLTSSISSSVDNYSASLIQYGTSADSSISTIYIGINELSSTIDGSINNYSSSLVQYGISTESSISTIYIGINELSSTIDGSINNYSSSLIQYGTSADSSISTIYIGINELMSTISASLDLFSSSLIGATADSTISTTYTSLDQITSSLIADIDLFSTSLIDIPGVSSVSSIGGYFTIFSTSLLYYTSGSNLSSISTTNVGFSNAIGSNVSSISTINSILTYSPELYASTVYTSSVKLAGFTQPFIQYGNSIVNPPTAITLSTSYLNAAYAIQLTYSNATQPISTLFASNVASNQFYVTGDIGARFYWTTFGQLF